MPSFRSDHVEVYLFRRRGRKVEFLVLRRAAGRLAGIWQPVTGTRDRGETAIVAARREVKEETGVAPARWWRLEGVLLFFDAARDAFQFVPRFVAEIGASERIRISNEHDASLWLAPSAAGRRCLWDSQRSAIAAVRREILPGGPAARALAIASSGRKPRRRAASTTRRK